MVGRSSIHFCECDAGIKAAVILAIVSDNLKILAGMARAKMFPNHETICELVISTPRIQN